MTILPDEIDSIDFQKLFQSVPEACLIISPQLKIIAVSDAYLKVTLTERNNIIGKPIFEVFPDNPGDAQASGVRNLRASLQRVFQDGKPDSLPLQRYDITLPNSKGKKFEERYWSVVNIPVKNEAGVIQYIIHQAEDITALVRPVASAATEAKEMPKSRFLPLLALLAVSLLTVLILLMFHQQSKVVSNARDWMMHSYTVQEKISSLATMVKDAQLQQISQEASSPANELQRLQAKVEELRKLVADNPSQMAYTKEIERNIATLQAGGMQPDKQLAALIDAMAAEERRLLEQRIQNSVDATRWNNGFTLAFIGFFYIGMLLSVWLATHQWLKSRQMQTAITNKDSDIEAAYQKLQQYNQELKDSKIFLKNILNHLPDPVFVKDREHRWIEGNNAFWELLGKKETEIVGKSDYDFFPKEQADIFWKMDEEVFTSRKSNINIENLTDASGVLHKLSTRKACFNSSHGEMLLVGVIRDITELTRMQDKLKESDEARLRSIMDHSGRLVAIKDLGGRYMQVNTSFADLLGKNVEDIIGKTDADIYPPEYAGAIQKHELSIIENGESAEYEESIPVQGEIRVFTTVAFPLYDAAEHIYGICRMSADITEKKQEEASKGLLAAIVESSDDAVIGKNIQGTITSWNAGAVRLFGYTADEAIGKPITLLFPKDRLKEEKEIIQRILTGTVIQHYETVRLDKYGHEIDVALTVSPIKNSNGQIIGVSKIVRDITAQKHAEQQLKRYMRELEHSNRELDDFAYIASHDLKEPLRGLYNHATFLIEDYGDKLGDDGVHRLKRLSQLSQRMERLVNDLLYFSRLGRTELAIVKTDINAVIEDIKPLLDSFLKEHRAKIVIPKALPSIICDKPRVTEVFRNLITNAVKYNDKEEPVVEIGFYERFDNGPIVESDVFYVKDNGVGIAPEFHEEIFRIFKRLQKPSGKNKVNEEGTGVGLTFVKKIIERHEGKIWLESNAGTGSIFYFTLGKK